MTEDIVDAHMVGIASKAGVSASYAWRDGEKLLTRGRLLKGMGSG